MNVNTLAILLCAIKSLISPGQWDQVSCQDHAQEYITAGEVYKIDPLVLVSIAIYECDLDDYKDVVYSSAKGIFARDICPTGLRIKTNLYETRGGFSRSYVINNSAKLLGSYKKYHNKHCKSKHNHTYLQHYNTGFSKHDNDYDIQVLEIYTALRSGKSTLNRHINPRTRAIATNIRKVTGHGKIPNYYKNCHPRNSCILASQEFRGELKTYSYEASTSYKPVSILSR
jgi:hypothetical protein